MTDKTETQALADEVRRAFAPSIVTIQHPRDTSLKAPVLVLPNDEGGLSAQGVEEFLAPYRERPERRKGTAKLQTLASFIEHVNRNTDVPSSAAIFADRTAPSLTCVFDYNEPGVQGLAKWGQHRAYYAFPKSEEWVAWAGLSGKWQDQATFAEFVETRAVDVHTPAATQPRGPLVARFLDLFRCKLADAGELLALAQGLTVHVSQKIAQHQRRETGEIEIGFSTENMTTNARGGNVSVPGAFLIVIPVFARGEPYEIPVRLRYRLREQKLEWAFELYRAPAIWDHAVETACNEAQDGTGLPLFYGAPES